MFTPRNMIITIVSIAVIGLGINAFADGGMGWGRGWNHHRGGMYYQGCYGNGDTDELSPEAYKQLEEKRDAFFNETKDIRRNLFEKERALQSELAKDEPDAALASRLQNEISELQSQFDQKRIQYMVEMRKLNPDAGRGYMGGGFGRGYGGHMMGYGGPMMGYGNNGGDGYCWR
jgi:zinc resistance-associated protein